MIFEQKDSLGQSEKNLKFNSQNPFDLKQKIIIYWNNWIAKRKKSHKNMKKKMFDFN